MILTEYMKKFILPTFIFSFFVLSCVQPSLQSSYPQKIKVKKSATLVVSDFLEALKNRDFEYAYEQVYTINSDREGYISRFESLFSDYDYKIIKYRVLGTHLYRETAIVVAEVEVDYKIPFSGERTRKVSENRYDLSIVENEWRITKDECIKNCRESPPQKN